MGVLSWLFKKPIPEDNTAAAQRLIDDIYTPSANCCPEVLEYDAQKKFIKFQVQPVRVRYVRRWIWKRMKEVTAVHHAIVFSELPYVFVYLLVRDGQFDLISAEDFVNLSSLYRLKFSGFNLRFPESQSRFQPYVVTMSFKKEVKFREKDRGSKKLKYVVGVIEVEAQTLEGEVVANGTLYNSAKLGEEKA